MHENAVRVCIVEPLIQMVNKFVDICIFCEILSIVTVSRNIFHSLGAQIYQTYTGTSYVV